MTKPDSESRHVLSCQLANKHDCSLLLARRFLEAEEWDFEQASISLAYELVSVKQIASVSTTH